jgi:hypothetical protein
MRNKPKITTRKNPGGSISYCVDSGVIDGKRHRKFFTSRRDAKVFRRRMQAARKKQGALAFALNPRQQIDAAQACELLQPYNVSLHYVAKYFVKHAQPNGGKKLISAAMTEFLDAKRKLGKKPRYTKELKCKLNNFKADFAEVHVNEITRTNVEEWLEKQNFAPITQVNYLRDLGIFFRWAMEARNYCAENVIEKIERPQAPPAETEIFAVHEACAYCTPLTFHRNCN